MEQSIVGIIQQAINLLNTAFSDLMVHLQTSPETFAGGAPWGIITTINSAIQGLGYGLLILFFLMSFFKSTVNFKDLSLQQIMGLIARFLLVKIVIDYGMQLLGFCINLSLGINETIFAHAGSYEFASIPQEVLDAVSAMEDSQWYERIGSFFQTIPMYIIAGIAMMAIWICGIIMVVSVYLRFFRVYIYTAIAPIPLSTFGGTETSQTGKHFLKAYAAVCLEICVIALAIVIFNAMMSSNSVIWPSLDNMVEGANADYWNAITNFLFQLSLQTIMLVLVIMGANKTIREALGV